MSITYIIPIVALAACGVAFLIGRFHKRDDDED